MGDWEMRKCSETEFVELIRSSRFPVFVCGAGISYGVAPLAQDMEDGLIASIINIQRDIEREWPASNYLYAFQEARKQYFTLEMLASAISYRAPLLKEPLSQTYIELFRLGIINRANNSISNAFARGFPAIILTANFDDGLYKSLKIKNAQFRILTDANISGKSPNKFDICAYHGTVHDTAASSEEKLSGPSTMTARELAHPFLPAMANYIETVFKSADRIFFVGHRGEDFYDMNLLIKKYIGANDGTFEFHNRQRKFYCVPHCGNREAVSDFYFETFDENNILDLGENPNWVADACDVLSGVKTEEEKRKNFSSQDVENVFMSKFNEVMRKRKRAYKLARLQAHALLNDINSMVFAVWSVTEHYRLESLALSQKEISAFGRPPKSLSFFGIQASNLLEYQSRYQTFRDAVSFIQDASTEAADIFAAGAQVYDELDTFSVSCAQSVYKAKRPIERASILLMQAIALDYMGLIGMRFEGKKALFQQMRPDYERFARSSDLFKRSWTKADEAGVQILGDEVLLTTPKSAQVEYRYGLEEIVSWRTWRMAPRENFARSLDLSVHERIRWLLDCIDDRMNFIKRELQGPTSTANYSVAGYAALCSLRAAELMRVLGFGEPKERGKPDFLISASAVDLSSITKVAVQAARICINVGSANSSQKNFRFMSAFDALILAALLDGDELKAKEVFGEAKKYAGDNRECLVRLDQIASRFGQLN